MTVGTERNHYILRNSFYFNYLLADKEFVRDCFLKLIPATDITYQGVYQKQFKDLTNYHMANPSLPFTISDRLLIMQVCQKNRQ
ncbi:hypothetical protein Smp_153640 [Schistosoma mansoni]|uniref:hypothetical protein n=1 Tax=Schistosoma mansoni TaxID=6183 RepID=UPI0001A63C64|nr:hypothetical protein Smp_153640 [Schistosoma mansoni]|eukprot:XP_018645867.1 hypothetical protein Smp_153640 [Schistosoma mansoni]